MTARYSIVEAEKPAEPEKEPVVTEQVTFERKLRTGDWKPEDTARAVELFNSGMSMGLIGDALGVTRSAVAGQIRRMRIKGTISIPDKIARKGCPSLRKKPTNLFSKAVPGFTVPKPTIVRSTHRAVIRATPLPTRTRRPPLRVVEPISEQYQVNLEGLEAHHCRWPIGDPFTEDFKYCGCSRVKGGPYCDGHALIAGKHYEAPTPKPRLPHPAYRQR